MAGATEAITLSYAVWWRAIIRADATVADQAELTIEVRADSGLWVDMSTPIRDLALGNLDYYYGEYTTTKNTAAFTTTLEYRAFLAQTGETTVYSPILVLAGVTTPLSARFLQTADQGIGGSNTLRATIPDPVLTGTVMQIERSVSGSGVWADDPGSIDYTFTGNWPGGTLDRSVLHDTAGDFVYRFTMDPLVGATLTSAETAEITVTASTTGIFDINDAGDDLLINDAADQLLTDD